MISSSIKNAFSLRQLYMSNNSLYELPIGVFTVNLVDIFVDGNNLKDIPDEIGALKNLRHLKFQNNNITKIPKTIGYLVKLKDVDLRNNLLMYLPIEFKNLKTLRYVYLHNNPICSNGWFDKAPEEIRKIVEQNDAGCTPQCSMYCQDRLLKLKKCVRECNSIDCKYQNGVCS